MSGILDIFRRRPTKAEEEAARRLQESISTRRKVLVVIDSEGHEKKYADIQTACKILKLNPKAVENCLKGSQKIHKGFMFREEEV